MGLGVRKVPGPLLMTHVGLGKTCPPWISSIAVKDVDKMVPMTILVFIFHIF